MNVLLLVACSAPDEADRARRGDDGTAIPDTSASTPGTSDSATGPTGDTGPSTTDARCANLPTDPLSITLYEIQTTEDFDFDAQGRLVHARWGGSTLQAVDINGNSETIATDMRDTRGTQTLSSGLIAIAYPGEGRVGLTDPTTGASWTVIGNLSAPNALEVGDGDLLFVTETDFAGPGGARVHAYDLATLESTVVADGFAYPNGLALNVAQDVLYVSDSESGIFAVAKDADGTWGEPWLVYAPADDPTSFGLYDAIEVDVCDNVYVLGFTTGRLVRFDPVTLESVLLVDLENPQAFMWNAIRWGSDRGGWRRDVLYVTDRDRVYGVEVGIDGRPQPVDLAP